MNFKQLTLISLLLTHLSVNAKEINLGYVSSGGQELPRLSLRLNSATSGTMRLLPFPNEVGCTQYRNDLCDRQFDIKYVEVELPKDSCRIIRAAIFRCVDIGPKVKARAVLRDNTSIELTDVMPFINTGEVTQLKEMDVLNPTTSIALDFQLWGHRADGLDPLIMTRSTLSPFITSPELVEVTKSLFDE